MWEMCCNKNPGDANAYLNDPKRHPQTRPKETKPGRSYLDVISNEETTHFMEWYNTTAHL